MKMMVTPVNHTVITANITPPFSDPAKPRTIAFTTPQNYATRLSTLLTRPHWTPLWCPTVIVESTPSTHSSLLHHLNLLTTYSAVAFTSRAGIAAFSAALCATASPPLPPTGEVFTLSALGKDAELLTPEFISQLTLNSDRVRLAIPDTPTPSGLVHSLGPGLGRAVLCPVPKVVGLEEPPVVPDFLKELGLMGWVAVRVNAYETRWAGPKCAERLLEMGQVDGLVFTSTAEVEGLLKGLRDFGLGWEDLRKRWPRLVVAAHGPVTASGAERLGVRVDVVSSRFGSFEGVVDALDHIWGKSKY